MDRFRKNLQFLGIWLLALFLALAVTPASAESRSCLDAFLVVTQKVSDTQGIKAFIKVDELANEFRSMARRHSNKAVVSTYGRVDGMDLIKVHVPSTGSNPIKVVMTAGLHGNEVMGPLASKEFLAGFLENEDLLSRVELTIYPMTSPHGLSSGSRRVRNDVDLNRVFTQKSMEPEVAFLREDLKGKSFDLALDLHGGVTRDDFFVVRAGDDQGLAEAALSRMPEDDLLESLSGAYPGFQGIPSYPERYLMSTRGLSRTETPGTLKSFMAVDMKVPYSYTLEYPGRMDRARSLALYRDLLQSFVIELIQRQD